MGKGDAAGDEPERRYSGLFDSKKLEYLGGVMPGVWGNVCEEAQIPLLHRVYNFSERARHLSWLLRKTSQHIRLDLNKYWRADYPHYVQSHNSLTTLATNLVTITKSIADSIWTPLEQLL